MTVAQSLVTGQGGSCCAGESGGRWNCLPSTGRLNHQALDYLRHHFVRLHLL